MATNSPDKEFKVLLIGDVRVGKTSFLTRYTRSVVNKAEKPTVGVEYMTKKLILADGTTAKAKLWDTAGSEKYLALTTAHYRESHGALLFFDLTDRTTFEHLSFWLNEIENHAERDTIVMLIGNKCDLAKENPDERQVSTREAEDFAKKCGLIYNETSAKTGENVKEAFEYLIETIHKGQKKKGPSNNDKMRKEEENMRIRINNNFPRPADGGNPTPPKQDSCCN